MKLHVEQGMTFTFELPLRIYSEANERGHWAPRANRAAQQRWLACFETRRRLRAIENTHLQVTLTRIAPRQLDDDNLARGFKAVRDGIAEAFGIDDGSPMLRWRYDQEKSLPRVYAVRVKIEEVES